MGTRGRGCKVACLKADAGFRPISLQVFPADVGYVAILELYPPMEQRCLLPPCCPREMPRRARESRSATLFAGTSDRAPALILHPGFSSSWWKAAAHQAESAGSKQNPTPSRAASVLGRGKPKSGTNGPTRAAQGSGQHLQTLGWEPAHRSEKPLVRQTGHAGHLCVFSMFF